MHRSIVLLLGVLTFSVFAGNEYLLPMKESRLVGSLKYYQVRKGDSVAEIARRYDVGFLSVLEANPGVDPFLPKTNSYLTLPTWLILPNVKPQGIVINLAELRLYYFPPDRSHTVYVFPIGIGRIGRETPTMTTVIKEKIENPTWTPTPNIRKEYLQKHGKTLPKVVPAGPNNPLGEYALRLAKGGGVYLIHGTNKKFGIGLRVSSGCIRMNPWDIKWLFTHVKIGTSVRIINRPLKYSVEPDGILYVEVHQPLSKTKAQKGRKKVVSAPKKLQKLVDDSFSKTRLKEALLSQRGIPTEIKDMDKK